MDWTKALCQDEPELWFTEDEVSVARAKRICSNCPLRAMCQEIGKGNTDGVWGGIDASELNPISPKQQEIAARRAEVDLLTRKGLSARVIAEQLGTTERNIQRDQRFNRDAA